MLPLASGIASADEGIRWRRTTPRATAEVADGVLSLRVPPGRAWGVESAPIAIEAGRTYRARARIAVPSDPVAEAFLRVALYERADGRGRQRARLDSPASRSGEAAERDVHFVTPLWARAVKLRLLVRRAVSVSEQSAVRAGGVRLRAVFDRPRWEVVLREVSVAPY